VISEDRFLTEDGLEGVKMAYDNQQSGIRLRQYAYFFGNGDTKYVITASTAINEAARHDATFDACVRTFRFEI
jgi:hypothetical protein